MICFSKNMKEELMARGRPLTSITLSEHNREQLQSMARSRSLPHGLVRRAKIVLMAADGLNMVTATTRLARLTSASRRTLGVAALPTTVLTSIWRRMPSTTSSEDSTTVTSCFASASREAMWNPTVPEPATMIYIYLISSYSLEPPLNSLNKLRVKLRISFRDLLRLLKIRSPCRLVGTCSKVSFFVFVITPCIFPKLSISFDISLCNKTMHYFR